MAKLQFFTLVGLLLVEIGLVNSQAWNDPTSQQYFRHQHYQQQPWQRNGYGQANIEIVQGTIDQLSQISPHWVCTNPKTGDQMIIGTETEDRNPVNNNGYPRRNLPAGGNVNNPWNVEQPYNHGQRVPGYNPGQRVPGYNPGQRVPGYNPGQRVPGYNPGQELPGYDPSAVTQRPNNPFLVTASPVVGPDSVTSFPVQTSTNDASSNKFDNFDWTKYVTKKPVETSSVATNVAPFDGEGILEARVST